MNCTRCGKENPAEIHTCTPRALVLVDRIEQMMAEGWATQSEADCAAELRRLHAENERLVAEVARRNSSALQGQEAVAALVHVHEHYENEVRVLTETLQRCKEVSDVTAECYRLDLERDEALLRQALEALEASLGWPHVIEALCKRLGVTDEKAD